MNPSRHHDVLLVEDTSALARTYQGFLRGGPYAVRHVETGSEALSAIAEQTPAVILLDLKLPDMDGMEILEQVMVEGVLSPVIVITAHGSMNTAIAAMRAGASDFLVKPFGAERLKVTLENTLERQQLSKIVRTYKEEIDRHEFEGFIGSSLAMQAVYRSIESAAASQATVFITGASGTGKELCAQAVHHLSRRRSGPFIAINCAAIPKDLMESEIFGHVKGAYTGAHAERKGAASLADGGTLFLDEICEMDPYLQSKLLRFVQTGTISKVGSTQPEQVDVRFVCATNRDPDAEVKAGRFREDLYYRLHVLPIHLPPLRERDDDIIEIARSLLSEYAKQEGKAFESFAPETEAMLRKHVWPGNVRQLQNVIRNVVVSYDGEQVDPDMLPEMHSDSSTASCAGGTSQIPQDARAQGTPDQRKTVGIELGELAKLIRPLEEVERQAIEEAIELCGDDVRKAAVFLKISPATIYRKLKTWRAYTKTH
jgi:two-component system repressor protein LuxO